MTILASSLSSVIRLGVESTFASPLFFKKLASAPSEYWPLMRGASSRFMPWPSELAAVAMLVVLPDASAAVRLVMLPPDWPELVPMAPRRLAPFLPSRLCHWTPNCASLLAEISTIRLSTSTCARRPSSCSMTARNWRDWGSGAVVISEVGVGSGWGLPPAAGGGWGVGGGGGGCVCWGGCWAAAPGASAGGLWTPPRRRCPSCCRTAPALM